VTFPFLGCVDVCSVRHRPQAGLTTSQSWQTPGLSVVKHTHTNACLPVTHASHQHEPKLTNMGNVHCTISSSDWV